MVSTVSDSISTQCASDRPAQMAHSSALVKLLSVITGVDLTTAQEVVGAIAPTTNLFNAEQVGSRFRNVTAAQLQQVQGISQNHAARILAALEFGKQVYAPLPQFPIADAPDIAAQLLKYDLAYSEVERFAVLILDIKHRAIAKEVISIGSKTECIASPAEIFRSVLRHKGVRCILAHCHPSGVVEPSPQDLVLTRSLLIASQAIDIPILDHLILSGEDWCSIRQFSSLWQDLNVNYE
jgi:DNA repair protein RadC